MKSLAFVLFVTTTLKCVSSNGRVQERADDGGPLETVVTKLSLDMSKMSAEFSLLKTELSDLKAKFGEWSLKRVMGPETVCMKREI